MATNLVSEIVEALGPTIVARIASALGLGEFSTQKAINAAVPWPSCCTTSRPFLSHKGQASLTMLWPSTTASSVVELG